jgi:beta-N-acetylhexosaminidase
MPGLASELTLEEQIGQILMVGFPGTEPTPQLVKLIQQYHVGNVVLFSRNVQSAQQLRELTGKLQEIAREAGQRLPLLIAIDQENGMVRRLGTDATLFPGNMALGAIGEEQSAYEVALGAGLELRALGVNLNLAPVVDVNNNPANPVIGVRSFGENPRQVARLAGAQIRGYQDAGIATCIKHFPGHGDTATDSHLAMPTIPYEMERLEQVELVPFKRGIAAGTDCVMSAHIYFPALMGATELPGTLSPAVIHQLLREQLGFQGVIMTDCLEMSAVSETVGVGKGTVLAQKAGNDLILISHRYDRQLAGIEALKEKLQQREQAQTSAPSLAWVGCASHGELRDQLYERSVTLIRDNNKLLPLRLEPEQRLLLVYTHRDIWTQAEDKGYPEDFLAESLRQRHPNTDVFALSDKSKAADYERLYRAAREAGATLMVTVNALLDARQSEVMRGLIATGCPLIGLAAYSPYDLLAFPELGAYLATYEYTQPAIAAAIRLLFGEIESQGKLPVSLPGLYPLMSHP